MFLPIFRVEVCVRDRVAAVQHDGIAHIDTAMAHAGGIVGSLEKHKVARFDLRRRNRSTEVVKALCGLAAHVPAGVIQHPRNVAAAIKAGAGRTAAPHIRVADVLRGFLHHGGKPIIL